VNNMRLGYSYHIPALLQANDSVWTAGYQSRFLDGLAAECEDLICFLHTPTATDLMQMDAQIRARNMRLVQIGPHDSVPRRVLRTREVTRILHRQARGIDAMLLRGPSPLLPAMAEELRPLPRAFLLVGDNVEGLRNSPHPWVRKKLIEGYTHWNAWRQRRLCAEVLTLVNSQDLYNKQRAISPALREVRTTTLTEGDFFLREDTCERRPLRMLYAGRLEAQKGLLCILDALRQLRANGHEIVFQFAGWSAQVGDFVEIMNRHAEKIGVRESIQYLGYRTVGPDLLQCYRDSDIFVLASEAEGFPRAIWEAMGSGLPVVATRVGSIPAFLRDGEEAVLVKPRDATSLAEGIMSVAENGPLRRKLIANGFRLAQKQTIEATVPVICGAIRDWIQECRERGVGREGEQTASV